MGTKITKFFLLAHFCRTLGHGVGQGTATRQEVESIERQLVAEGKIQGNLLLSLDFVEVVPIYEMVTEWAFLALNPFVSYKKYEKYIFFFLFYFLDLPLAL